MARPVSLRTERTYRRDVEHLSRLRTAIQLDLELESEVVIKACEQIDALTRTIRQLIVRPQATANSVETSARRRK